jgi:hypothetical protein
MAFTSFSGHKSTALVVILIMITCSAIAVIPVSAATKYIGGSPSFSASVVGINEFVPGQDATISILVKNSGTSTMKQLNQGTIEAEDLPTTAKFVTIGLSSDNDAIIVKTDSQMIGDIPAGGDGVIVTFNTKISTIATTGEYQLPLAIGYKFLDPTLQEKADVYEYTYTTANDTLPITLKIKPQVKIEVLEATPDPMSTGTEGYLHLKIRNSGLENGTMAVVKLVRSGKSAIIPTDSTVYIGDFPSGGIASCQYKIAASSDATGQTYPVDIIVSYMNHEGTVVTSAPETIGIPVNTKTGFTVISPVPSIAAGSGGMIEVQYRNDGNSTAFATQSRISPHGSVTINYNTAYLGDIKPGESATARYEVLVDGAAEPQEYTFDSTVRFRDALGNSQKSDTIPVAIKVLPAKTGTVAGIPIFILIPGIILVILVACIGFWISRGRKRLQ